ncbi:hypothetical protein VN97_g6352, partial [Penicillium thymicola]
DRISLRSARG